MAQDNDNKTNAPPDQETLAEQVKQIDEDVAALRARFDQFFLGLEKRNPQKDLDALRKRMLKLKKEFVRNTGLKFRIQTLHAKFLSYERLWLKSLKEIEEGTYSRDLFKLRRKKGQPQEPPAKKAEAGAKDEDKKKEKKDTWSLDDGDLEADLPDELFGGPEPVAPPLPSKPIARQKTDPALPDEVGGFGSGPRPQSPPPPPSGAVVAARPAAPPPAPPRPPPSGAVPIPRQPTNPPQTSAPLPRQPTNPPQAPAPLPRQATNPPAPPPGAVARPPAAAPQATAGRPPASPPAAGARPPPAHAGAGGDGLSSAKVKMIYDAFVTAKKRCKESTDGITLEAVEQSLRKQVPQLMKESGAKSVDFKVVIKDGKAVLKAVPK